MPVTTLYLVRHGEPADDADADPGLSERGRGQARAVGRRLAALTSDAPPGDVLHGSRVRTAETAAMITGSMPGWAARHSDDVEDRTPVPVDLSVVPERYRAFLSAVPRDERDPEGARLGAALRALSVVGDQDRTVVAVTHAFVIAELVRVALDAPTWRWISLPVDHASLTILRWDSTREPRLLAFNDTGHL